MTAPKILEFHFDGDGPATIAIEGYPDRAIGLAREILGAIFSLRGAWHLTKIECAPPALRGKTLDSEWLIEIEANLKDPGGVVL